MPKKITHPPVSPPEPKQRVVRERVRLSDASCKPGLNLMERIAHSRRPSAEDIAIMDSWRFRFPVRIATGKEQEQF